MGWYKRFFFICGNDGKEMWQPILSHTLRVWICVDGFGENPTRQRVRFAMGRTVYNNEISTKIQRHFLVAKCCGKKRFAKHTI